MEHKEVLNSVQDVAARLSPGQEAVVVRFPGEQRVFLYGDPCLAGDNVIGTRKIGARVLYEDKGMEIKSVRR